jgi:hypothetical protein
VRITVNRNTTRAVKASVHAALADALEDVTETGLGEANRTVPIEEATLERSGFAQVDRGSLTGQIAYDTPYAVVQHEDPTLAHDPGRRHHWLEDSMEENKGRYVQYVGKALRSAT